MDAEPRRFRRLRRVRVAGVVVPVAAGFRSRLLGLALLGRERAGAGLLIPRCRSVHTLAMRFPIDIVFLDRAGRQIRRIEAMRPGRTAFEPGAAAVLELPVDGSDVGEADPGLARRRLLGSRRGREPLERSRLARQEGEQPGDHRQSGADGEHLGGPERFGERPGEQVPDREQPQ
jgi:uncharacterized membrane protein (UPF0127 family)